MMNTRNLFAAAFAVALSTAAFGCGGSDGKDGEPGQPGAPGQNGANGISAMVVSTTEPAGSHCANGGTKLEIGMDADSDGILIESEIVSTQYVCNGTNGQPGQPGNPGEPGTAPTITTATLNAGEGGCANGGIKITVKDGESSVDQVLCNGANGQPGEPGAAPTVAMSRLGENDTHCPNGGMQIDITVNGTTNTQYVCDGTNGQPGTSSSIVTTTLDVGDTDCPKGGVQIEVTNENGSTTHRICNGTDGQPGENGQGTPGSNGHNSLINMIPYEGTACASGSGIEIISWLDLNDNGELDTNETSTSKIICNGANGGGGAIGCAAEAEDYCLEQAIANDNELGVCDTTTGNCVECLETKDCGTDSGKYCSNKVCVPYCGDGIVNNGEDCDPAAPSSEWKYGGTCDGYISGTVGEITCSETCVMSDTCDFPDLCGNEAVDEDELCDSTADKSTWTKSTCADVMGDGYIGELGCAEGCKQFVLTGCTEDPCADVESDGDCKGTGPNNAKTCLEAWGDEVTVPDAYVVCEPHPTCPGVYKENIDATLAVCEPDDPPPAPTAPISWCTTQHPATISATDTDKTVYVRIPTSELGNIQKDDDGNILGVKLIYSTDTTSSISTWASIAKVENYAEIRGGNTEYKATIDDETYNALANGTYYYAMAITGNGTDWFYCPHAGVKDDGDTDNGGAPTQTIDTTKMGTMVIENDVPPQPTGHVVINQFMTRGNTANDEFIELYNQTSSAVDLSSYVLWKSQKDSYPTSSSKIELTGTIPAHGYYIITTKDTLTGATGLDAFNPVTPDQYVDVKTSGLFGGMNNNVILFLTNTTDAPTADSMANVIDYVGAGNASIYEGEVLTFTDNKYSNNTSVSRTNGVDTDNNKNDFTTLDVACPRSSTQTTCPGLKE